MDLAHFSDFFEKILIFHNSSALISYIIFFFHKNTYLWSYGPSKVQKLAKLPYFAYKTAHFACKYNKFPSSFGSKTWPIISVCPAYSIAKLSRPELLGNFMVQNSMDVRYRSF
jgi:hypothetical protein